MDEDLVQNRTASQAQGGSDLTTFSVLYYFLPLAKYVKVEFISFPI